ncbi:hypothetical protein C9374_008520 [Naegleria lovaniensis]|uniref:Uncharacterized protein n=1 Tax=Naegleria lovaniensis TaxID=51637 RepID=A0AA88GJ98_NAELO|nr:uncharacterized protein C9374_008520 [Naegleria lovaniensis]KAG2378377.1 hypothetical protein C9374_008520 [Naegleria lovaniensis]
MYSFGTLYKPVKNVLSTGASDKISLSVNTKANPDFSVGISGSRTESGKVDSALSWSQKLKCHGVACTVNGSLDQDATVKVSVAANGVAKGLNADLNTKMKTEGAENNVTGTLDYTAEKFHLTGHFDYTTGKDLLLASSVTGRVVDGLVVGAEAQIKGYPPVDKKDLLKKYTLGARYSMKNIHIAAQLEESLKKIRVGYAQQIDDSVTVAGEFLHDLKSTDKPTFTLGTSYTIDKESSVKANINTKGVVNATYTLVVNPRLTTAVSVESSVFTKSVSKVGLSISYDA